MKMPNYNISVVYYFRDMSFIFIFREKGLHLSISLNIFKNNLKDILTDVNKSDRFHITVQGWTGTL